MEKKANNLKHLSKQYINSNESKDDHSDNFIKGKKLDKLRRSSSNNKLLKFG